LDDETQWGAGVEHAIPDELRDEATPLCSEHWLHAYADPLLAVLMRPVHLSDAYCVLWECEAEVVRRQADKVGCWRVRTVRVVEPPAMTVAQRVRCAILAALEVYDEAGFVSWARGWLDGSDRSADSAYAATYATNSAAATAAFAAYYSANAAADAAAFAAADAAEAKPDLDLVALARRAVAEEPAEGEGQ